MKVYINNIQVRESEIDELNHVNNVVYLQWVNDVSALHWDSLSNDEINLKYIWVAVRHEIDYLKPAFLNEKIIIKTWIATLEGVKSVRKVEIYRGEELLAKSKTTWVLLDAKTQKITRIPKEIEEIFKS
jgi:acyl-CoA thioester hydrolase